MSPPIVQVLPVQQDNGQNVFEPSADYVPAALVGYAGFCGSKNVRATAYRSEQRSPAVVAPVRLSASAQNWTLLQTLRLIKFSATVVMHVYLKPSELEKPHYKLF